MSSTGGASNSGSGLSTNASSDRVEIPGAVLEHLHSPTTPDDVAEFVRQASKDETGLLIAGGRTRLHWANPARNISTGLCLRGLSGIREFEPEEGVIQVWAGTSIRAIGEIANAEGWELALDPPGGTSTIGGTIASAATGPRAHAFGRVADVILGLDVVGADGVRSKCGGRVVKNVTGYDMAKLYCGSFGSLAVICGAWLRLRPVPVVREAYVVSVEPAAANFEMIRLKGLGRTVRALIWTESPGDEGRRTEAANEARLVVEFAGSPEGVAYDREQFASGLDLEAVPLERVDALADDRLVVGKDPIAIRVRVLASKCGEMVRMLLDLGFSISADAGIGVIHARGRLDQSSALLEIRRRARGFGGLVFVERLPEDWRDDVDVFDDSGDGALAASVLKDRFDPGRILNPGRFAGRV
ncbi:MAG TPA: FAD-binding oxidoreductase [Myxococcales bacterium]|nr:FAD-binding oxidoreductase [Myxococcales bacterium]HIK83562.1 FAD-binding oxidoreductase [Myxococcales bacterium]